MDKLMLRAAIDAISQEINKEPENALLLRERGRLYMMIGEREAAMQDMCAAVKLKPELVNDINGEFRSKE